jgi:hypothetical protein
VIFAANPNTLGQLWPHALPHLERFAEETGLVSPDDLYKDIHTHAKQLWMVSQDGDVTAAIVTQIFVTLRGKTCCVYAACGNSGIPALLDALTHIEKWAMEIGCITMEVRGRRGWKRALPEYKETGVTLEKQISHLH